MYCPRCFNNSLNLNSRVVARLFINGKHRDTGVFMFNPHKDSTRELEARLKEKVTDFFKWYSTFQNKELIEKVELLTADVTCGSGCPTNPDTKVSVIGLVYNEAQVQKICSDVANRYGINVQLNFENS